MNDSSQVGTPPADTTPPPPAQTDNKDWTWVLERPCPDCGLFVGDLSIGEIVTLNRSIAADFATALRNRSDVRSRPAPDVWSPLEYGAHVRDVFRLFLTRLELMLSEDDPLFANWDPNETQEAERYDLQDPDRVAGELLTAGESIAARFDGLHEDQLDRTGRRSDGAAFTVLTFARYEIHDPYHHLWDITTS